MTDGETIPYLSAEWLQRADALLSTLPPVEDAVEVAIVIRSGPAGERRYRMVLGPDRVGMDADVDKAGVRMTMDWDVAVAIAKGEASAQRAFLDGRLQLGGDASLLLGHQQQLAAIEDNLKPLRAVTSYR